MCYISLPLKDVRFIFKNNMGTSWDVCVYIEIIDGSVLPEDCVEELPYGEQEIRGKHTIKRNCVLVGPSFTSSNPPSDNGLSQIPLTIKLSL